MLKHKITISTIILIGFLVSYFSYFNVPSAQATDGFAGWANFAQYQLKEFVLDTAARVIARLQMNASLKGIANQVLQSGRTGRTPAFIQNWRNLITDGQYRGEDVFRAVMGNTAQCPYFRNELLNTFGVKNVPGIPGNTQNMRVNNLDPYKLRADCTMPQAWSINTYRNDFSGNGGWDALVRLSQPQNNFYGSMLMSMAELNAQRGIDTHADTLEAGAGGGYFGVRKSQNVNGGSCDTPPTTKAVCEQCTKNVGTGEFWCFDTNSCVPAGTNCGYSTSFPSGCAAIPSTPVYSQARCTFLGSVSSPGDILGQGAAQFIDKHLSWLTTSDEVSEILGSFIGAMMDKLVNYAADRIVDSNSTNDSKTTQYNQCVTRCNNTSSGSQNTTCIANCYKQVNVNIPTCASGGNCGLPSPGGGTFCDGTDADSDGNICDASIGEDSNTCPADCGAPPPPPPPPPPPGGLPNSTAAFTVCNDGTATPTNSNVCLTAQWFKAGVAGAVDLSGQCATSNCVVLNYNIWDGSGGADIYKAGTAIFPIPVSDYTNGTRTNACNPEGNTFYGIATTLTPGINLPISIPIGGAGTGICP